MGLLPAVTHGIWRRLAAGLCVALTAAVVPVAVGTALAWHDGHFAALPALAALVGAVLIQIGTNLANDVADFERGADTAERLGPTRVTQSGLLSAGQVRAGAWLAFGGAAVAGLYLVAHAGWPIAVLGVASIASGWAYTGGPWPLGYHGLGDVFVFVFFGIAAVVGTYYVQAGCVTDVAMLGSVPVGALATAILAVNNTRDRETDLIAGKRTVAVRCGDRVARGQYVVLLAVAYALPLMLVGAGVAGWWVLLTWLTAPEAWSAARSLVRARDGAAFNVLLRRTARLHARFGVLFALGLLP